MEWLIKGHLVEIAAPKTGCLAMYSDQGVWQHVGLVVSPGRVISQWGTFPVYEHDVCEVPNMALDRQEGDCISLMQVSTCL